MVRPFLTLLFGWAATTPVLMLSALPGTPAWTAWVGGMGAGFLAVGMVLVEDGVWEDAIKAGVLTGVGILLLTQDVPGWMVWPLLLGPWVGFFAARRPSTAPR